MAQQTMTTEPVTAASFYLRAEQFIKKFGNEEGELPTIKPGTDEFSAWRQYFQLYLRWTPVVLQEILDGRRDCMTVPSKFPQIFDQNFVEQKWEPRAPTRISQRLTHETMDDLRRRYGPNWGLKVTAHARQAKREWHPPTDDELRALYSRRKPEAAE